MENQKVGWVYFIKCNPKYYKVGITTNSFPKRLSVYRTHNPHQLNVLELIYVSNPDGLEKYIHDFYFKDRKSKKTDWAELEKTEVDEIIEHMVEWQNNFSVLPDYKRQII